MIDRAVLQQELERAWELRTAQRIEECLPLTARLRHLTGAESDLSGPAAAEAFLHRAYQEGFLNEAMEVIALVASLARAQGDASRSRETLQGLARAAEASGWALPARVFMETGLNALLGGDFLRALDQFLLASAKAEKDLLRLQAVGNTLICLESLGSPFERTLSEFREGLDRVRSSRSEADISGYESQLFALEQRQRFHQGQLRELDRLEKNRSFSRAKMSAEPDAADQGTYFSAWASALPFVASESTSHSPPESINALLKANPHFHQKAYRIRTLQGISHPDDIEAPKPSSRIERVYLWTWKWLTGPESFDAEKVVSLLDESWLQRAIPYLTAADRIMLRNVLLWLSFFDPQSSDGLPKALEQLEAPANWDSPLLSLERLVAHYLIARRDRRESRARDFRKAMEDHPLWDSDELAFRPLIEAIENSGGEPGEGGTPNSGVPGGLNGPLRTLARNAADLLEPSSGSGSSNPIERPVSVDLSTFEIRTEPGRKITSEPMCLALELLHSRKSVSCAEFAGAAFGLWKFDPIIHQPKIFNLVARIRALGIEGLRFQVKSGFVRAEGPWSQVAFLRLARPVEQLRLQPEWRSLLSRVTDGAGDASTDKRVLRTGSPPLRERERFHRFLMELPEGGLTFTRRQLAASSGQSKSSANRLLSDWQKRGWIRSTGSARATRYEVTPAARMSLLNGGERGSRA